VNARRATLPVAAVLVLAGVLCFSLRSRSRDDQKALPGDTFWRVVYKLQFTAKKPGAKVFVALPVDTQYSRITEGVRQSGDTVTEKLLSRSRDTREVVATTQRAGAHNLTFDFSIHLSKQSKWRSASTRARLTAEQRAECLQAKKGIEVNDPIVRQALDRIQEEPASKVDLVERIFDYCFAEIGPGGRDAPSSAAEAIKEGVGTALGKARAMVALCRAAMIPSRLVTGFQIMHGVEARPHVWVEVLNNKHWEPYDPEFGFTRELPHNVLCVRRDGGAIVRVKDATALRTTFAISRVSAPVGSAGREKNPLDVFDLTRLPLEMHDVFALILLMPLGALVTAFFRTMVGIRTFGTFTPTLLALSFVYADWRTGIVVFITVLVLGFAARKGLDRLKLLLVPRLSVILTLVALLMVFGVSLLDYFDLTPSAQAVLLPMVILTMTVERFFLTSEEDGVRFACQLLFGTLAVGLVCYGVLRWEAVGRLLLVYPEMHLFTVALLVMMGRYTGYRLNELLRFRDLAERNV